jgi:glycosyltransferase involved in cell wall biosynthesis
MRIAHVMLSKGWGGAEKIVLDAVQMIARHGGHRQLVVLRNTFARGQELEALAEVDVVRVAARGDWDWFSSVALRRAVAPFAPDIIHAHLARGTWMAGRAGYHLGVPVLSTLHNYMRSKYARQVDYFTTITRDAADYVASWPTQADRIRCIPNFSTFGPVTRPTAFDREPPVFLALGRFARMKAFDVLLPALRRTIDRLGPARLLLAGDGERRRELMKLVNVLDLGEAVEFVGWVEDVRGFFQRGDVFVLPSRHEPFGIVALEAMASGKVIVSTDAEGPREILDESTAFMAQRDSVDSLADAMVRALRDRECARARAAAALARFTTHYTADAVMPRQLAWYEEIVRRGKIVSARA